MEKYTTYMRLLHGGRATHPLHTRLTHPATHRRRALQSLAFKAQQNTRGLKAKSAARSLSLCPLSLFSLSQEVPPPFFFPTVRRYQNDTIHNVNNVKVLCAQHKTPTHATPRSRCPCQPLVARGTASRRSRFPAPLSPLTSIFTPTQYIANRAISSFFVSP